METQSLDHSPTPPVTHHPPRRRRYQRSSIVLPLLLIILGGLFLLKNVVGIQGTTWDFILRLWPLILIALGLDNLIRRQGVVGPVFWMGLGVVFLLSTLGFAPWNVWDVILRLWPLLLVAIGLDIVIGRRSLVLSLVAVFLLIAIMAGAMGWMAARGPAFGSGQSVSQALNGAQQAEVTLKPAVGTLNIQAIDTSNPTGDLLQGMVNLPGNQDLSQDYQVAENQGHYQLGLQNGRIIAPTITGWRWDLSITQQVPVDLVVNLGAGVIKLDASNLDLKGLGISYGIGSTEVSLPSSGSFSGQIDGAIGQITIRVPKGSHVRIDTDGLSAVSAPSDFQHSGRIYTSPGYDRENPSGQISLDVSQAIGVISIVYD